MKQDPAQERDGLPLLAPDHPRSSDLKCLRCGAFNLPENHVCGKCGANLPLVYDEEGKIFNWRDAPYFKALVDLPAQRRSKRSGKSSLTIAFGVTAFVLLVLSQVFPRAANLLIGFNFILALVFIILIVRWK